MTACTNNGGSRARRAVTAALVGVLSVGAAPMVALATTAAPVSGDVSLQAEAGANIKDAKLTYETGKPGDVFVYDGEAHAIVPATIDATVGTDPELSLCPSDPSDRKAGEAYYYYVDVKGSNTFSGTGVYYTNAGKKTAVTGTVMFSAPTKISTYAVVAGVWNGTGWDYVEMADTFSIASQSLKNATLFEGDDVSDTTFSFTGETGCNSISSVTSTTGDYAIHAAVDGVALPTGSYTVKVYKGGQQVTNFLTPGTYTVRIEGQGVYAGQDVEKTLEYGKLNLSDANIVTKVFDAGTDSAPTEADAIVDSINDVKVSTFDQDSKDRLKFTFLSAPGESQVSGNKKGAYTFKVGVKDENNGWITGSKDVTVYYADEVASVDFGNGGVADGGTFNTVLTSNPVTYFDLSEIKVTYGNPSKTLSTENYTVKVLDAEGNKVTGDVQAALKQPGKYTVVVEGTATIDGDFIVVDTASCKVNVGYGDLTQAAHAFLAVDGKNIDGSDSVEYTGEDFADTMEVKVVAGDKTLVEGTDYEVSVSKLNISTGVYDAVDSMTDAGQYKVTIKGITCTFRGQQSSQQSTVFDLTVKPATIDKVEVKYSLFSDKDGKDGFLPYTGEEITPTFVFYTDVAKKETIEVPASAYEVSYKYGKTGDFKDAELKDVCEDGYSYTATLTDALNTDNFDFGKGLTVEGIVVSDAKVFVDVPNGEWYTDSVYTAYHQGYIVGIGGSDVFAPLQSMSRADLVCVLYRMAGGDVDEVANTEDKSYLSDFEDVDVHAYYAKAVAWATKVGISKGYGTTFGTERLVSTEEFVTMLARYAELMGTDTTVDTDAVLAGVADGDEVSGYARDAVAWAVENGYVASNGNLIDPQGTVYRGRVVTIAVRYQPEQANLITRS